MPFISPPKESKNKKNDKDPPPIDRNIVHDCNNVLGALKGFASFLMEDLEDQPSQQKLARKVLEASLELEALINQTKIPSQQQGLSQGLPQDNSKDVSPFAFAKGSHHILFVEDQEIMHEIFLAILDSLGCHGTIATTGQEAINLLRNGGQDHVFSAVFTDSSMPNMSGIELADKIYEEFPNLPVVLISGHRKEDIEGYSTDNKAIKYFMQKPVIRKDLAEVLEDIL